MTVAAATLARLPDRHRGSTSAAASRSAAATRSSSRGSSARPAYVVAEDDLRARARAFVDALGARHADYDVLFASKAFPCTAVYRVLAEEGLACDVASGGELRWRSAAGSTRRGSTSTATPSPRTSSGEALAAGVGHIVLDSLDEIDRLDRDRRRSAAVAGRRC